MHPAGIARLADEYSTYRGRSALDALILDAVPYKRYRPGLLHRMLLTLPWADVLESIRNCKTSGAPIRCSSG